MTQLGFYIDQARCIGCEACVIACKDKNDNPVGVNFRRVYSFEEGSFTEDKNGSFIQNIQSYFLSISCNHCDEPKCVENCPTTAMFKREEDGVVVVDQDKCVGCRYCEWNCPYGAPQYNEELGKMTKCDLCIDLLEKGERPACEGACPVRAIEIGPIDELRAKYGNVSEVKGLPTASITKPNLVINTHKDASE
ncbi:DMSO/selenate family reductase complex B subunit [Lentibacillus cibarius]|uniref:Dimethylsulfoxide reductase subunit B n=1 Tax=Lentibacillus cibarius TaxID=2583219 RepID=A0A5S3R7Z8_9BACI|nr:DMSO/selenate family reductase complex B subunit [Lentibacillus cibarius]TMN23183.1 dimethylsulfoxide reductase subunit B [Lentibacillus cibarius]